MITITTPDVDHVLQLQHVRGYPAVSPLLSTTPARTLAQRDASTLDQLHAAAVDRLSRDERAGNTEQLLDRLDLLVRDVKD